MSEVSADRRFGNTEWVDNWTLGAGERIEIMEESTANVWLCQKRVTPEEQDSLVMPEGFAPALTGGVVADAAYFSRSPDADLDGPLDAIDVGGLRFVFVARPMAHEVVATKTALLTIDKWHTMLYKSGRTIEVLDFGDGTVAVPAWSQSLKKAAGPPPELAPGWSIRTVELSDDLIATIPNPATVAFLSDGRGFHGPLREAAVNDISTNRKTQGAS